MHEKLISYDFGGKLMFCPECGIENSNEAQFCKNCGKKIPKVEKPLPNNKLQQKSQYRKPLNKSAEVSKSKFMIRGMFLEHKVGLGGGSKVEQQQGTAILQEKSILIRKKSFFRGVDRGEKHIRYDDIITVDLDRKGIFSPGAIEIYTSGTQLSIRKNKAKKLEPFFKELTKRVHDAKNQKIIPHQQNQHSPADELRKYAELRDEGIISEEEFEIKKKEILGL